MTNVQDRAFVEMCQNGASSPAYEPGPYMKSEYQVEAFIGWYVERMREYLGIDTPVAAGEVSA
jgi:Rieske 2Fe-2S family protein